MGKKIIQGDVDIINSGEANFVVANPNGAIHASFYGDGGCTELKGRSTFDIVGLVSNESEDGTYDHNYEDWRLSVCKIPDKNCVDISSNVMALNICNGYGAGIYIEGGENGYIETTSESCHMNFSVKGTHHRLKSNFVFDFPSLYTHYSMNHLGVLEYGATENASSGYINSSLDIANGIWDFANLETSYTLDLKEVHNKLSYIEVNDNSVTFPQGFTVANSAFRVGQDCYNQEFLCADPNKLILTEYETDKVLISLDDQGCLKLQNLVEPQNDKDAVNKQYVDNKVDSKQDLLISGTNIKTVNGQSLLGSGNLTISGSGGSSDVSIFYLSLDNDTVNFDYSQYKYTKFIIYPYDIYSGSWLDIKISIGGIEINDLTVNNQSSFYEIEIIKISNTIQLVTTKDYHTDGTVYGYTNIIENRLSITFSAYDGGSSDMLQIYALGIK